MIDEVNLLYNNHLKEVNSLNINPTDQQGMLNPLCQNKDANSLNSNTLDQQGILNPFNPNREIIIPPNKSILPNSLNNNNNNLSLSMPNPIESNMAEVEKPKKSPLSTKGDSKIIIITDQIFALIIKLYGEIKIDEDENLKIKKHAMITSLLGSAKTLSLCRDNHKTIFEIVNFINIRDY